MRLFPALALVLSPLLPACTTGFHFTAVYPGRDETISITATSEDDEVYALGSLAVTETTCEEPPVWMGLPEGSYSLGVSSTLRAPTVTTDLEVTVGDTVLCVYDKWDELGFGELFCEVLP